MQRIAVVVSFIDGDKGILRYRGSSIEELARDIVASANAGASGGSAAGAAGQAAATGEPFSFFVASLSAMRKLSGSQHASSQAMKNCESANRYASNRGAALR